jgi:hypothetical protein
MASSTRPFSFGKGFPKENGANVYAQPEGISRDESCLERAVGKNVHRTIVIGRILGVTTGESPLVLSLVLDLVYRAAIELALIVKADIDVSPTRLRRGQPILHLFIAMWAKSLFRHAFLPYKNNSLSK